MGESQVGFLIVWLRDNGRSLIAERLKRKPLAPTNGGQVNGNGARPRGGRYKGKFETHGHEWLCHAGGAMRKVLLLFSVFCLAIAAKPRPQTQSEDWEQAAGGKMAFDVASVKPDTSDKIGHSPSFALDSGDAYPGNMTLFSAEFPLATFISFAYKLPPFELRTLESQLPKWATSERFDIEARAASPSTKDQMRLMMQSLLADRFQLKAHFETKETPVFALVLVHPGRTGPDLRRYAEDPACSTKPEFGRGASGLILSVGHFPPMCYTLMGLRRPVNGAQLMTWGSRNVSMSQIANDMPIAPTANLDRPVIDRTGLSGSFDFLMNFAGPSPVTPDGAEAAEPDAPTFLEALKERLGLKLESTTAPVESMVIDHIEEPTAN